MITLPNTQKIKLLIMVIFTIGFLVSCEQDSNFDPPDQGDDPVVEDPDPSGEEPEIYGIPVFNINTGGREIIDEPKVPATLVINHGDAELFSGHIGIELRGASSLYFAKKQYGIESWDASGQDIDVSLLDYPMEEDFILNGPYADKSLMRNKLVYDLAREMGQYASRAEFIDTRINGQQRGVYVLLEKIKRDAGRVDIAKLKLEDNEGEELTGGYIIKIDKGIGGGYNYNSSMSWNSEHQPWQDAPGDAIKFQYVEPKYTEISFNQREYIQQYMKDFENALASENFKDPEFGYRAYADIDSFVDFFILNELGNNVDGYRLSTYMHKKKNGKLHMGPIWDFNFAFGNADYCSGGEPDVWAYKFNERCGGDVWSVPFWWERLMQDPYFVNKVKDRWSVLRGGTLNISNIHDQLDGYFMTLAEEGSITTNFTIWNILNEYLWPNRYVGGTYENEFNYLKDWVEDRVYWLDTSINNL